MNAIVHPLQKARDEAVAHFAAAGQCGTLAPPKRGSAPDGAGSLSKDRYDGNFDSRKGAAVDGAQSTYDGTIAATLLERDLVSAILPPQMRLATPHDVAWRLHPVVLMLGRQNDPLGLVDDQLQEISNAVPYYELILLVPYVVRLGKKRFHSYSARMYLDNLPAINIGNTVFAYSKLFGEFSSLGATTEVLGSFGNAVFETDIAAPEVWLDEAHARAQWPTFADVQQIFEMPVVGHNNLLGHVRSYFEWDYSNAQVGATSSIYRFRQAFRAGMQPWVDLGFLSGALDATFSVRHVRWRLSTKPPGTRF